MSTVADALIAASEAAADELAAMDAKVTDLTAQNEELRAQVAALTPARFPGDPKTGHVVFGVATTGGNAARVVAHEKATGVPMGARRRYYRGGAADLAVPNGPVCKAILEDHAAGRVPAISVKPGTFADQAAGDYDDRFARFFAWCEQQPKVTWLFVNHEPQNDGKGAADFRAAQQRIRRVLNQAAGGMPKRVAFAGSLMAYGWSAQGKAKFGQPVDWFPGAGVWDFCGLDQYAQTAGQPIIDAKYLAAIGDLKSWGVVPAVTELGIRDADPAAATKLTAFVDQAVNDGCVCVLYYDDNANSTGDGWEMDNTHGQLDAWRALLTDERAVRPNAG